MTSPLLQRAARRLRALFDRRGLERELDEELRFHLEMEQEHLERQGVAPGEARARAVRTFGGVARTKDAARDARGLGALEEAARDGRMAWRSLRRSPVHAAVALLTLALGIGATTAVFSVVDGTLLRPLPYPEPGRLVALSERSRTAVRMRFAGANVKDAQAAAAPLAQLTPYAGWTSTVLGADGPQRVGTAMVGREFLDVLGVRPAQGRGFAPDEGGEGRPAAALVSHRFWQQALGGRADWAERTLRVGTGAAPVVGVMPPGFDFPAGTDVWLVEDDTNPHRTAHNWAVVARLRPGATLAALQARLDGRFQTLKAELGNDIDAEGVTAEPLQAQLAGPSRTPLLLLLGAVALVLCVGCVNLASAGLARAEARHRELAVRAALGAGRARLVRLLLAESLLLGLGGGALGALLAVALTRAVRAAPGLLPAFADVRVDARVLGFTLLASVVTGLGVGLAPALTTTRDLRSAMAAGGAPRSRLAFRRVLLAGEVALAVVLLVGAGLLTRSLGAVLAQDPGFRSEGVLLADVSLPSALYTTPEAPMGDPARVGGFFARVLPALAQVPGVDSVAVINQVPLGGSAMNTGFMLDGGTESVGSADYRVVSPAYFATVGVPLLRGRGLTDADAAGAPHVVLVNRAFAERFFPGQDPLGHRVRPPGMDAHMATWATIVGVVGDVRQRGLEGPPPPQLFFALAQRPERLSSAATLLVRSRVLSPALSQAVRDAVHAADPNAPVTLRPMDALVEQAVASRRVLTRLLTGFSALALFLAAVGVYGVLAYAVALRRREIGVRMALGARRAQVGRDVVVEALRAVLPGAAVGLAGAAALSRVLQAQLFGIQGLDAPSYAFAPALLILVAIVASAVPALRATRVDPAVSLRAD